MTSPDDQALIQSLSQRVAELEDLVYKWNNLGARNLFGGYGFQRIGTNFQFTNEGLQQLVPEFGEGARIAIAFVNEDTGFMYPLPSGGYYSYIAAGADNAGGTDSSGVSIGAYGSGGTSEATVTDSGHIWQVYNGVEYAYLTLDIVNSTDAALTIGSTSSSFWTHLVITGRTNDPSFLSDGALWYRSDTDKFRARINGATENLATEPWVTSGFMAAASTFSLSADISPTQITSNQNDYSPTGLSGASVLRLSTDATRDLTGLTGGADGRVLLIFNVGSNDLVLKDESASSSAANRFALNGDLTLAGDESAPLWYDGTSSRWRAF